MSNVVGECELCGCICELTLHHLIPVSRCKNKYKKEKNEDSNHIMVCRPCHDAIHSIYTETELRDMYRSKEALEESEEIKKFVAWRRKHQDFKGSSKMSNSMRRKRGL